MSASRRRFLKFTAALLGGLRFMGRTTSATAAQSATGAADGWRTGPRAGLALWFAQPAVAWADALPVGNGRLGAMVFGGIRSERIALNESTLWSGAPGEWNNPDARNHLPRVRKRVLEEHDYQAADLECFKMMGPWNQAYEPVGDLLIEFHHPGEADAYRRDLDLDAALAGVSYRAAGVAYRREVFVSKPDDVIVVRLTANKPGAIDCTVKLVSLLQAQSVSKASAASPAATAAMPHRASIVMSGKAPFKSVPEYIATDNGVEYSAEPGKGMHFAAVLHGLSGDGRVSADHGTLRVESATEVVLIVSAATGYRGYQHAPDAPLVEVIARAENICARAAKRHYQFLRELHLKDYRSLFHRVSLELGPGNTGGPDPAEFATDRRLANFARDPQPDFLALLFNFGRYLLISSSRPDGQPANLQGIWNAAVRPPWSCNWTTNINVQMNYWLAETCNLSELHLPLISMVRDLSENGAKTARINYGAAGWVSHHNVDLWRQSGPAGGWGVPWAMPTWANYAMSGPWLCAHLWEHYAFSGDRRYLRDSAYPVMKGAAEFCLDWLIDDGHGGLTTCPSVSTENVFRAPNGRPANVSAGCTHDIALMHELFQHCIEAAAILGVDREFAARLSETRGRLLPYRVGRWGQLQEWSIDFDEEYPGMRHMSHLYPLYPGAEFTPRATPELAAAARKSLERRLEYAAKDNSFTGWGRAWAIALWARLADGDNAWESLKMLVNHSLNGNLFDDVNDTRPAGSAIKTAQIPGFIFEIDANFGAPAAIAEMLLQSHAAEIAFLPALPSAWTQGNVRGLRARGAAQVDISWSSLSAAAAVVRTDLDREYRFRAPKGLRFAAIWREVSGRRSELPLPLADGSAWGVFAQPGDTYCFEFAALCS